uniref:Secreted protein n=1 Tax=Eutreptiella gymnastica TaxID=73025 RepID=A0A7S1N8Y8_9EUGL
MAILLGFFALSLLAKLGKNPSATLEAIFQHRTSWLYTSKDTSEGLLVCLLARKKKKHPTVSIHMQVARFRMFPGVYQLICVGKGAFHALLIGKSLAVSTVCPQLEPCHGCCFHLGSPLQCKLSSSLLILLPKATSGTGN